MELDLLVAGSQAEFSLENTRAEVNSAANGALKSHVRTFLSLINLQSFGMT